MCRYVTAFCLIATTLVKPIGADAQSRVGASRSAVPSRPQVAIAVVPFKQSIQNEEGATLGAGIADSLTNALKGVDSLQVADTRVVEQTAAASGDATILQSDQGAMQVGEQLGLAMLVSGSYQYVGGTIVLDARILNVSSGLTLPGSAFTVSGTFPAGYGQLLKDLNSRVVAALRIPVPASATVRISGSLRVSQSSAALRLYNEGIAQLGRVDSTATLEAAVAAFAACLEKDPAFALAYAAKAEATLRLAGLRQRSGEQVDDLAKQARSDAQKAVQRSPNLGRAQGALAQALNFTGEYVAAAAAARRAATLRPNDIAAKLELNKAQNKGQVVRSPDLDRAFQLQPWVVYLSGELPKVVVRNEANYDITIAATPLDGAGYPILRVKSKGFRVMAVVPGTFSVAVEGPAGQLLKQYVFRANSDYEIIYRASDITTTTASVTNRGNAAAYVAFVGPTWTRRVVVNPGGQENFEIQAGAYTVTCSGSEGGGALKTIQAEILPNREYSLDCSVIRTLTFR